MQKCLKFCKMLLYLLLQDETREGQLNFICTQKRWLVSRIILRRAYVVPFCFCRCKHSAKLPRRFDLRGFCFYLAYIFEIWERELIRVGSIIPTQLQPLQDTHRIFTKCRLCATHILWPQTNPVGQPIRHESVEGGLKATHQKGDVITTFRGKILEFPFFFNLWLLIVWGIKRPPYGLNWLY